MYKVRIKSVSPRLMVADTPYSHIWLHILQIFGIFTDTDNELLHKIRNAFYGLVSYWKAWLSDGQCQKKKTKQNPKISMLRDNRSNMHYSHQCYGSTHLPPTTAASGTEWGEVSCSSSLESGMLVLHPNRGFSSILMRLQQSDPIFNMGVDVMRPAINFNPNIGLLCWLGKTGPKELALLLQSRGSSDLEVGPRWGRGPELESMGNLWEERSAFL